LDIGYIYSLFFLVKEGYHYLLYSQFTIHNMSEVEDFLNKIKTWRSTDPKIILQVLHRLAQTKTFKLEELELLSKSLADFHKQIGKADENEVDAMWF